MKKDKGQVKEIAGGRIKRLFELAKQEAKVRPELSVRYVKLAREMARKAQTKIPRELKRGFCKKCTTPFTTVSKVRTKNGFLIYSCVKCGKKRRFRMN